MNRRVVVIGGGIIGAACAHYLNQSGWQVTIVERKSFGCGASHANCGLISPSHILPLAGPHVIARTLKAMISPNSPFSIKPRLDWSLWRWMIQFARHCNQTNYLEGGKTLQRLLNSSRALFQDLMDSEPLDVEWQTEGVLFPYLTKAGMEQFAKSDAVMRQHFGHGAQRYDGDELINLEPALKPGLTGGWHFSEDAHLRPDRLMSSWKTLLEARGVIVHENCPFQRFISSKNRIIHRAVTGQGEFEADAFVVATGAWTPLLNQQLGCRVPIQPGKGYSMTMSRPSICPKIPMIFNECRVAVTPWPSGYRLGSIMEFTGFDESLNPKRLELLKTGARQYLREPTAEPIVEQWYGWRPMTPDSLPIIDRSPAFDNVYLAVGHNMLGISLGPVTGKLISEFVNGTTPHLPIESLSIRRF